MIPQSRVSVPPNAFQGDYIQITSGEQFVPLFLIFANNKDMQYSYNIGPAGFPTWLEGARDLPVIETKEKYKEYILNHINSWNIEQYTFYIPLDRDGRPSCYNGLNESFFVRDPGKLYEPRHLVDYYSPGISAPFYYGEIGTLPSYTTLRSGLVPSVELRVGGVDNYTLKSRLLLVVKAKYLKYLRACVLLEKKDINLPFDAIKLLRTPVLTTSATSIYAQLIAMFKPLDMEIEYVSNEVINSFLFKTTPVNKAEVLSRIKTVNRSFGTPPIVFE